MAHYIVRWYLLFHWTISTTWPDTYSWLVVTVVPRDPLLPQHPLSICQRNSLNFRAPFVGVRSLHCVNICVREFVSELVRSFVPLRSWLRPLYWVLWWYGRGWVITFNDHGSFPRHLPIENVDHWRLYTFEMVMIEFGMLKVTMIPFILWTGKFKWTYCLVLPPLPHLNKSHSAAVNLSMLILH